MFLEIEALPHLDCFRCLTALMSAVKGMDMSSGSVVADGLRLRGLQSRRQDPKTPVEQALMRGLATA